MPYVDRMAKVAPRSPTEELARWWTGAGVFLAALLFSWYFVHLRYRLNQEFPLATLQSFLDGTAHKPFQLRMLIPWLVAGLKAFIPADIKTLYQWIDVAAVLGLFYAFRYHLKSYFQGAAVNVLPFALFYVLPWNYLVARDLPLLLPYDMPAVFFFTLTLALLHRRKWKWYYPVFTAAVLNHETILFLTLLFVVAEFPRLSVRALTAHVLIQVGIWVAIKALMASLYAANPGGGLEYYHVGSTVPHWRTNLNVLASWPHLILFLSTFGFSWVLIPVAWRRLRDPFVRKSLWLVPPFPLLVFLFGNLNEARDYGELTPVILTAVLLIVADLLRGDDSKRVAPSYS